MVKQAKASSAARKDAKVPAKKPIEKAQKPASPVAQMLKKRDGPKWSLSKLAMGQYLSMTSYMTVIGIGNLITVRNQFGQTMQMSKELLETMYSAQHYAKEVALNMTGLAELLQSVQDHAFTVVFKKQATEENAMQALLSADNATFSDAKKLSQLAKQIITGQDCTMTCHMVQVENNLGRSLVIDLKAAGENKFRQVDHRTIDSIIFKNTRYSLKKGGSNLANVEIHIPKDEPKWDAKKLAIGDIFSGTSYYETVSELGNNEVFCHEKNFNDRGVTIDRSLFNNTMENACIWEEEEQLSLTKVATKLTEANNMAFQVCFTTKPNEKKVMEDLQGVKGKLTADKAK